LVQQEIAQINAYNDSYIERILETTSAIAFCAASQKTVAEWNISGVEVVCDQIPEFPEPPSTNVTLNTSFVHDLKGYVDEAKRDAEELIRQSKEDLSNSALSVIDEITTVQKEIVH